MSAEDIVVRLVDGRGVVEVAPEHAWISVELLAEIALGRGNDAAVDERGLVLGTPGMGLGRVRYEVGPYDPSRRAHPLTLLP